jgi:multiple sugar transport system permease protein
MSAPTRRLERALLLLPAGLLLSFVVVGPILRVIALSFTRTELDAGITIHPAGLEPYVRLWQDARWWSALRNTAVFTLTSVGLEVLLGTAFAFLLHRRFRGRGLVRALVVLPWALPTAVLALAWAWIFHDSFGVLNDLLGRVGLVQGPIAWLGTPTTAMVAMIIADVWKATPFVMLIALAGLQGIPESVIEAARVDGLSAAQANRRVVLPLLAPSLLVAVAFRLVQATGAFDLPYVLTGGGPAGSTETISLYAYQNDFRYLDFGYGSAIAVQGALLCAIPVIALMRRVGRVGGR